MVNEQAALKRYQLLALTTKEQNSLVLYDLLREKRLKEFLNLVKKGYVLTAFILNYLIDSGFENAIPKTLKLSKRSDPDIYDFLVLYWGQEKTEDFLVDNGFDSVIKAKFSEQKIVKYQLWNLLMEMENYRILAEHNQVEALQTALKVKHQKYKIFQVLIDMRKTDLIVALGGNCYLLEFEEGRQKLLKLRDWGTILDCFFSGEIHKKFGFETLEQFYQYVIDNGGSEQLFLWGHTSAYEYLLKQKITAPFVNRKYWSLLIRYGFYDLVDWEDYWQKSSVKNYIIRDAAKAKNWDFLEKHECQWVLFKKFRWCRLIRVLRK